VPEHVFWEQQEGLASEEEEGEESDDLEIV
jgi:hypothetical protein